MVKDMQLRMETREDAHLVSVLTSYLCVWKDINK